MERLKKALEKAQAQRQGKKTQPPAKFEPEMSSVAQANAAPLRPDYVHTRRIEVDERRLTEQRIIVNQETDPRAVPFRLLRTHVLQKMRAKGWRTLAITAPTRGAGKSMVVSNLAVSMASDVNQTVLLVDLDFRRPSIHRIFGFEVEAGLRDYFESGAKLGDLFVNPSIDRLTILPGHGSSANSAELIGSPKMKLLVEELKARYESRLIIFDLPPTLADDDALAFLPLIDCGLLVIESGVNTEVEIQQSQHTLQNTQLIGSVLNKSTLQLSAYY